MKQRINQFRWNRILTLSIFFLFTIPYKEANAQIGKINPFSKKEKTVTDQEVYNDGAAKQYTKVMLIPYDPVMHISDADVELVRGSGKSLKEVHRRFRLGLDLILHSGISSLYNSNPMLRNQSEDGMDDLRRTYGSIGYKYEKVVRQPFEDHEKKLFNIKLFKKEEENQNEDSRTASGYLKEEPEDKYMNVTIRDSTLLPYLAEKYGTDLFLFVNQFEIRTKFEHCLDFANKQYSREIMVHYSLYNRQGEQLYGDAAVAVMPSNSNNIDEIIRKTFPVLSDFMVQTMPQPPKTEEELAEEERQKMEKERLESEQKRYKYFKKKERLTSLE